MCECPNVVLHCLAWETMVSKYVGWSSKNPGKKQNKFHNKSWSNFEILNLPHNLLINIVVTSNFKLLIVKETKNNKQDWILEMIWNSDGENKFGKFQTFSRFFNGVSKDSEFRVQSTLCGPISYQQPDKNL
jgi:hypothetical protein